MGMYDCTKCGSPRMNTFSGSVCSQGCSERLQEKAPRKQAAVNEWRIRGIPNAKRLHHGYEIEGESGVYLAVRVVRSQRDLHAIEREMRETGGRYRNVVAISSERLLLFRPVD